MNGYTISKVNEGYVVTDKVDMGYVPQMWAFSTLKEALDCVERLFAEEAATGKGSPRITDSGRSIKVNEVNLMGE